MTDRGGIFAGSDPFVIAQGWLTEATKTEPNDPNAIALATVDETGLPNVRMVLLKEIESDAFVFTRTTTAARGKRLSPLDVRPL